MSTSAPSLLTLIGDVKTFFLGGFLNMPMAITGTLLIVSLMTANYSMLFMAIGILLIVPISWYILHMFGELVGSTITKSDLAAFIPGYPVKASTEGKVSTGIGIWAAMMMFILGYLLSNAVDLYTYESKTPVLVSESTKKMLEEGTSNRKSQAIVSIAIIAIIILTILVYRIVKGLDPVIAGLIGTAALLGAGSGWYKLLASQTEGRLSDVFGIANRILKPMAMQDEPLACLPQGQANN